MKELTRRPVMIITIIAILMLLIACSDNSEIAINMPALKSIPDGTYIGTHFSFPVRVKVAVEVGSGKIVSFKILRHFSSAHGKPAEELASMIVDQQTLLLDVVSGASHSSRVILKAGENALRTAK